MFRSENVEISTVSKEKAENPHGLGVHRLKNSLHVCNMQAVICIIIAMHMLSSTITNSHAIYKALNLLNS